TLLASAGVAGSVVVGAILTGGWRPSLLPLWGQMAWCVGLASALVGLAFLANALAPRAGHTLGKSSLRYFGHFAPFKPRQEILDARDDGSSRGDQILERAVDQLWIISSLVSMKYARIRFSLFLFATAAALMITAMSLHAA